MSYATELVMFLTDKLERMDTISKSDQKKHPYYSEKLWNTPAITHIIKNLGKNADIIRAIERKNNNIYNTFKYAILGSMNSGKSTLFKQLTMINNGTLPEVYVIDGGKSSVHACIWSQICNIYNYAKKGLELNIVEFRFDETNNNNNNNKTNGRQIGCNPRLSEQNLTPIGLDRNNSTRLDTIASNSQTPAPNINSNTESGDSTMISQFEQLRALQAAIDNGTSILTPIDGNNETTITVTAPVGDNGAGTAAEEEKLNECGIENVDVNENENEQKNDVDLETRRKEEIRVACEILEDHERSDFHNLITSELGAAIKILWGCDALKHAFNLRNSVDIADSAPYFLNDIDRMIDPDYEPTDEDLMYVYIFVIMFV